MRSRVIILLALAVVILSCILFLISRNSEENSLSLEETRNEVLKEVQEAKAYVEETAEWSGTLEDTGEIGFYNPPEDSEHQDSDPKLEAVKFFVAGLIDKNSDIFLSSFHPESISADLFKSDNPDKLKVSEEIIIDISRSNTIKDIKYHINKGFLNQQGNTVTMTFTYTDNKKATFDIELSSVNDSHQGHDHSIYVITTSVWTIIEEIKKSTD